MFSFHIYSGGLNYDARELELGFGMQRNHIVLYVRTSTVLPENYSNPESQLIPERPQRCTPFG